MLRDHSRQHQKWNLGMPCERQVPWYYLFGLVKKPFERIPITWGTNTCINKNNIFTAISRKNVVCHTLSRPRPRLALGRLMHQSRIIARLPVFSFKNNPAFILKISVHLDCHAEIQELDLTPSFQLLKAHCLGIHDLEHVKHFPVPAWNWFPAFRYISTMPQPLFTLTQFSFIYFIWHECDPEDTRSLCKMESWCLRVKRRNLLKKCTRLSSASFCYFPWGAGDGTRALPRQSRHSLTRLYPGSQKTCWIWRLKESAVKYVCCFCQIPVEFVYAFFCFFSPTLSHTGGTTPGLMLRGHSLQLLGEPHSTGGSNLGLQHLCWLSHLLRWCAIV